jgi:hypothetical protein
MYENIKVHLARFEFQEGDLLLVQSLHLPPDQAQHLRDWISSEYPSVKVLVLTGGPSQVIRIPKDALSQLKIDMDGLEVDMKAHKVRGVKNVPPNIAQIRNTIRNIQGFVSSSAELQQISPIATRALNTKLHALEEAIERCLTF